MRALFRSQWPWYWLPILGVSLIQLAGTQIDGLHFDNAKLVFFNKSVNFAGCPVVSKDVRDPQICARFNKSFAKISIHFSI